MFEGCPAHPQSSIHVFFGNSDLRELCFHYVDPPTLLTVSTVCRSFRASCFSIEFLRQRLTAYKRVLHNQMPTPSKRDFEGFRPDVMLMGADGQYLMIHHKDETDICGTEDWETSSVIVFPSERMYRDVPRIESPGLFAIGSLCFGFEKGDPSCWKVVVRQVSDWSTASERHLETNPISKSPTEFWGTLGLYSDLLVQFSRSDGIIAVWDSSLRRSWLLPTSSHIDHLVVLPSGNTIVAFGTDSKIYVWEDIIWKDTKGPVRMKHRSFAVPRSPFP
jgi:hypothetical protein